ncbi:MAG: creatininase family protein [Candidatus Thermoplasmatota archaeon]|nr:creatininase family protein [Candidatus Thermoplasmatota archaeon]
MRSTSATLGRGRINAHEITSPTFAKAAKDGAIAILPIGSMEEHGSHLPLGTDSMQAEEIAGRIADEFNALLLPPIRYGECRSTRNFPGTISLSFETVYALTIDIVSELSRNGIDRILVLTGHAGSGHMAAIRLGVQRVVENDPELKVMVLSDYDIAYELRGKEFPSDDGHAGLIETSRILNLRKDLVGRERPVGKGRPPKFMIVNDPERYIPTGVMGDPRNADADRGRRIDDFVVDELCALIRKNFGMMSRGKKRGGRRGG